MPALLHPGNVFGVVIVPLAAEDELPGLADRPNRRRPADPLDVSFGVIADAEGHESPLFTRQFR